jgi:hypothetical protein
MEDNSIVVIISDAGRFSPITGTYGISLQQGHFRAPAAPKEFGPRFDCCLLIPSITHTE